MSEFSQSHVLIVDDDHLTVEILAQMLESIGPRFDASNHAKPAQHLIKRSRYDVVITDLDMPDINGYELACWVREQSPSTKVIIMTGSSNEEIEEFRETGIADQWMLKPFKLKDLETVLGSVIDTA